MPGWQLDVYCLDALFLMVCNRLYISLFGDFRHVVELEAQKIATDMTIGSRLGILKTGDIYAFRALAPAA